MGETGRRLPSIGRALAHVVAADLSPADLADHLRNERVIQEPTAEGAAAAAVGIAIGLAGARRVGRSLTGLRNMCTALWVHHTVSGVAEGVRLAAIICEVAAPLPEPTNAIGDIHRTSDGDAVARHAEALEHVAKSLTLLAEDRFPEQLRGDRIAQQPHQRQHCPRNVRLSAVVWQMSLGGVLARCHVQSERGAR